MAIWVREFMCRSCDKRHRVEGLRGKLGKLQKEREDDCEKAKENEKDLRASMFHQKLLDA